jgi:deoxyhypusine synthase
MKESSIESSKDKEKTIRNNVLKKSVEIKGVNIEGYDFNEGLNYDKLLDSYATIGMQASNFAKAVDIINKMQKEKAFIFLGYTSNMVTSGMRDIFRYLAEHKKIDVIVTTVGGIEEDIIKCFGSFILGDFRADGAELRKKGINRAGNIFIPNSRYCDFEDFIIPIFDEFYERQKKTGKMLSAKELIWKLGEKINDEKSIYYWCWKNKIPVFCPAITDGSLGDMIYFFKSKHPDFVIDVSEDIWEMNNSTIDKKKTGVIVLGGGVIKHHIANANLFRNGSDYVVYINDAVESTGSDAGALPEEAVSWGKVLSNAEKVKLHGDAILLFPLIVAKCFI